MSEENFEFSKEEGEMWDRFLEDTVEEKYEDSCLHISVMTAKIIELEKKNAALESELAQLKPPSLKAAYDQLLVLIKESEEMDAKLIEEFGSAMAAREAEGVLDRPEVARLHYDVEWDVLELLYDRVPVIFRGF
jgi:hypothetical protein